MILKSISLDHFRSHNKCTFAFDKTTVIIGKNTAGKTNILEAIYLLSSGKSFRAEKEVDTISSGSEFAKITGVVEENSEKTTLSIIISNMTNRFSKKYLVNNIARRQVDFASHFYSVLFTPEDLDIISSSPSLRRRYIDSILSQSSREYRVASSSYEKSLRQRNRMLSDIKDGKKYYKPTDFLYWDNLLIEQGTILTTFREDFVRYINTKEKDIFNFTLFYDRSIVSEERLQKYYDAERASGVTLVGPQRDEFIFFFPDSQKAVKEYGSRGEQRLTLLQTKVFEIRYLEEQTGQVPTLLLDDIFSELDAKNIEKVFELIPTQQTIITTTHEEFVPHSFSNATANLVKLS